MKKKYMKLIGSIVLAFCLVATGVVATISAQAEEETTVDTTGWKNVGWSTEAKEYTTDIATLYEDGTIPDGYLFAGWYDRTGEGEEVTEEVQKKDESTGELVTDEDGNPVYETVGTGEYVYDADDFTAVRNPKSDETWYVKYVPEKMLSVKAQNSANIIDKNGDTSVTANNSIRFVTSLDSIDYSDVGFKVFIGGVDQKAEENKTNFVYKTIYEIGATDTSKITSSNASEVFENLASKFFKTYTITYIPESVFGEDITVIPYYTTYDGTTVYGTATVRSVDFCCGTAYVTDAGTTTTDLKVDNFDASGLEISAGTYNSPATLPEAVANKFNSDLVDVTVYIKENITLKGQATVKNTMTITSLDKSNPVTITGDPTASYSQSALIRVGAVGVTVRDVTIDGENLGEESPARAISVGTASPEATPLLIQDVTIKNIKYKGSDSGAGGAMWTRGYVVLSNSTLKDCSSAGNGGHIYIFSDSVELKDNSLVSGGTCAEGMNGGNIYVSGTSASLVLTAGTIEDGECVGTAKATGSGGNIYSHGIVTLTGGIVQNGVATTKGKYDEAGCGGNIYLTTNGSLTMTGGTVSGGQAIKSEDYSATSMSGVFGGGNICSRSSEVTISGNAVIKDGITDNRGGNIFMSGADVDNPCTLTIENATAEETLSGGSAPNGASIFANRCATTIQNVTKLSAGTGATNGGFMYVWAGSVSLANATIDGGSRDTVNASYGGGIYLGGNTNSEDNKSSFTINKGTMISNCTASIAGGNIYISTSGSMDMTDGTITLGTATSTTNTDSYGIGGNIYCDGSMIMRNGEISEGKATNSNAYNKRVGSGGNIAMNNSAAELQITGGTIKDGRATGRGGNIFAYKCGTFTISNATVENGKAKNNGGNINTEGAITLGTGAIVQNGHSGNNGGNVCAGNAITISLNGGSITGGKAKTAGNVYCYDKVHVALTSGKITNGFLGTFDDDTFEVTSNGTVSNLYFAGANSRVKISDTIDLDDNTSIGISQKTVGVFATGAVESDKNYFTPDDDSYKVDYVDSTLKLIAN